MGPHDPDSASVGPRHVQSLLEGVEDRRAVAIRRHDDALLSGIGDSRAVQHDRIGLEGEPVKWTARFPLTAWRLILAVNGSARDDVPTRSA